MEKYEINKYLDKFSKSVQDIKVALNEEELIKKSKELNGKIVDPAFWNDLKSANQTTKELNAIKEKLAILKKVETGYKDILDAYEMFELDQSEETNEFLTDLLISFNQDLDETLISVILTGPYDNENAILEIHPGAGGTESMDWASMLFRMYQRYAQRHHYSFKVIDYLAGEDAGIKSVTVQISGKNAYGYLKAERGVHRLVRISPFDANKRRHTSFASVDVSPFIKNNEEIVINDNDLKIDTFCSSGPGGQGVNTTYSAVRITHKPTGIVVSSQEQRSQIQNREQCMMVLRSKLLDLEIKRQEEELANLKGGSKDIAFGSQIRSYVFCPYTLVKDHRTQIENGNINAVMDGDIDSFIYGYLKWMCKNE